MKSVPNVIVLVLILTLLCVLGCTKKAPHPETSAEMSDAEIIIADAGKEASKAGGKIEILQSWQGDYPVAQLNALPEGQREHGIGYIPDAKAFEDVWTAFKPGESVPEIDFKANLVLFARNKQFFNRVSIGKVQVTNGVAEVVAMETMSARPIEDKVAMSLAVVPRDRIRFLQTGDESIPVSE